MVEDLDIIIEGYRRIVEQIVSPTKQIEYKVATTCDMGWKFANQHTFDLAILDLNFPITPDSIITSGEDLGQKIRAQFPETKIIILTGVMESNHIYNIIQKINPEGFLLKGETNSREIYRCLHAILNNSTYYSPVYSKHLHPLLPSEHQSKAQF